MAKISEGIGVNSLYSNQFNAFYMGACSPRWGRVGWSRVGLAALDVGGHLDVVAVGKGDPMAAGGGPDDQADLEPSAFTRERRLDESLTSAS